MVRRGLFFLRMLWATIWLSLAFARAAWYFKRRALHDLGLPQAESLSSKEKRRLQHYLYGATYLSVIFCMLRNRIRSRREKHRFTNLAALAYFFDDLVDSFRDRDDSGILWQDNPEVYGLAADGSGLALHFLHNIYQELPPANLPRFRYYMHQVFNVETAGRQQDGEASELPELQRITAEKGGYSVLLFRSVLDNPLSEQEGETLYQLGYLVQLCDDIFDLWFDRKAGLRTAPRQLAEAGLVLELAAFFEAQVNRTRHDFGQIKAGSAWAAVHFLVTVTRVCLQHYLDLQKKHGTLPLDDRAAMVVDMERWEIRIRAAWYLVRRI